MTRLRFSKPTRIYSRAGMLLLTGISLLIGASAWSAPGEKRFPISVADIEAKAQARFEQADTDSDGSISLSEFEATRPDHPAQRREHRQHRQQSQHGNGKRQSHAGRGQHRQMRMAIEAEMFNILDKNTDGQLSREEHAAGNQRQNRQLARKRAMFKHLDKNSDGRLSKGEMPNPGARLAAADADGDGSVTAAEMRAHRKAQRSNQPGTQAD